MTGPSCTRAIGARSATRPIWTGWPPAGRGVLHSFTVQRLGAPSGFEADTPYALGVVKLAENVQLLGRLWPDADGGWDSYACDAEVEFHPAAKDEIARRPVAWFRLSSPPS